MELTARHHPEWAETPSFAPNDPFSNHRHDTWKQLGSGTDQTLGLSPYLLNFNSLGTINPFSPAEPASPSKIRCKFIREASVPVDQLMEEILWPQQQLDGSQQEQLPSLLRQDTAQPILKDIPPSIERSHKSAGIGSSVLQPIVNSGLAKRRRGRPRLYPPPIDVHHSDVSWDIIPDSRRSQLEKNRVAAEKCRRRRKEYTTGLLADFSVLSSRNEVLKTEETALREELIKLKTEILRHAGCGSSIIDGYIAKTADTQLIAEVASKDTLQRRESGQETTPASFYNNPGDLVAEQESEALPRRIEPSPHVATNRSEQFELLNDFIEMEER